MKNMSSSTSTPNNFGCHSSHLTVKDNYRKGIKFKISVFRSIIV